MQFPDFFQHIVRHTKNTNRAPQAPLGLLLKQAGPRIQNRDAKNKDSQSHAQPFNEGQKQVKNQP